MKNSGLIISGVFVFFILMENIFPLRVMKESKKKRTLINFAQALLAFPFTRLLTYPLIYFFAEKVAYYHWGILNLTHISPVVQGCIGFLLLDYLIYWWHRFNHTMSFFWRFHQVHHADKDMDATTALRFHFGELVLSGLIRIILILVFGFAMKTLLLFDLSVTALTIFHHSNLKLPASFEKWLGKILVTPSYHQNHHSYFQNETDSNYATIFNFWDRLHQSITTKMQAEKITIGLPQFHELNFMFLGLVALPFSKIKPWPKKYLSRN